MISLNNSDGKFELQGKNIPSKLFCGIANWIGHLISDVSGSSSSKGRGMGIPSPIWAWSNDVIAIKAKLNIPVTEFDKSVNELALKLFEKGYDVRFQTTQAIPVFINEMVVRLLYSIRRLIGYYISVPKKIGVGDYFGNRVNHFECNCKAYADSCTWDILYNRYWRCNN